MSIKTGKYGKVSWDPAGGTALVEIISLNAWTLSEETSMEDVTCFGDTNKVYVPGMKDLKGTVGGFWNSADLTLWKAADAGSPGTLSLAPNNQEPGFKFQGLAYLNASIDCSLAAPTVKGTWAAAASWTVPGQIDQANLYSTWIFGVSRLISKLRDLERKRITSKARVWAAI